MSVISLEAMVFNAITNVWRTDTFELVSAEMDKYAQGMVSAEAEEANEYLKLAELSIRFLKTHPNEGNLKTLEKRLIEESLKFYYSSYVLPQTGEMWHEVNRIVNGCQQLVRGY